MKHICAVRILLFWLAVFSPGCVRDADRREISSVQPSSSGNECGNREVPDAVALKRVVYDNIINAKSRERVVAAIPDEDYLLLRSYYQSGEALVRPMSVVTQRADGTYFSRNDRLPAVLLDIEIVERSQKRAIVLLSAQRGLLESLWRYELRKTPSGWVVVDRQLELAT